MANISKTLIVVEGGRLEPGFFEQLKKVFGLNLDLYCLEDNIYVLYNKMKEMGFNANLKDVLKEMAKDEKRKELLSQNFAYTYLIFDFDIHHTEVYEKDIPYESIVCNNIAKVKEMAQFFVNETDPTIGKLYINYPMMESFKDCDSFDDEEYLTRAVSLTDAKSYKRIVGVRKMANKRVDGYTKEDFRKLTRQNVMKLKKMSKTSGTVNYDFYTNASHQNKILECEIEFIESLKAIAVLNTSVFLALDYFGNKDGFFDFTMKRE